MFIFSLLPLMLLLNAYVGVGRRFDHYFKEELINDESIDSKLFFNFIPAHLSIHSRVSRAALYAGSLIASRYKLAAPLKKDLFGDFDFSKEASFLDWLLVVAFGLTFILSILLAILHYCL